MDKLALTVREAAERLGCSEWLVRKAVKGGVLPVVHESLAGRRVLIPSIALEGAIEELTTYRPANPPPG